MVKLTRRSALAYSGAALLGLAACGTAPGQVEQRYAPHPQGDGFVVIRKYIHEKASPHLQVVLDWESELAAMVDAE